MNTRKTPNPDNPFEYSGRYVDMRWPSDVPTKPFTQLTPEQIKKVMNAYRFSNLSNQNPARKIVK